MGGAAGGWEDWAPDSGHPEGPASIFWLAVSSQAVQQQPEPTSVPPAPRLATFAPLPLLRQASMSAPTTNAKQS